MFDIFFRKYFSIGGPFYLYCCIGGAQLRFGLIITNSESGHKYTKARRVRPKVFVHIGLQNNNN